MAIKMVIGWRIQLMVQLGREVPDLLGDLLFSDGELRVLATFARSRKLPPPARLGDAVGLVARLGGWLGRTRDPPGAQLMWHGYTQLVPWPSPSNCGTNSDDLPLNTVQPRTSGARAALAPLEDAIADTGQSYFLTGYGASRRLGRPGIRGDERSDRAGRVRTLFDADATLRPLASWAMDLHYVRGESFLRLIRSALAELLPDATFRDIDKARKTLVFDTADGPVSLDDLSDGYQNVAAWVGDLLYRTTGAFDDYSNPLATRGLLLIDEIDLHLHVKWQRRLRRFIENKLPNFQTVATTHSPMTAQQAGRGEVRILARPTPDAAPELRGYDIAPDRLGLHQLIEPFFDVDTVDSARIASLKDQYRALKTQKRRSVDEEQRLEALRDQLADAPAWNGGEEAKAQIDALRSIQALLEKAGVHSSGTSGDKAQEVESLRSRVGRKVVVE